MTHVGFKTIIQRAIRSPLKDLPEAGDPEIRGLFVSWVKEVFNFIIAVLQATIFLGALQYARNIHSSFLLGTIFWALFIALWFYMFVMIWHFLYVIRDSISPRLYPSDKFLAFGGFIAFILGGALPYGLIYAVNEFIHVGFQIN